MPGNASGQPRHPPMNGRTGDRSLSTLYDIEPFAVIPVRPAKMVADQRMMSMGKQHTMKPTYARGGRRQLDAKCRYLVIPDGEQSEPIRDPGTPVSEGILCISCNSD